MTEAPNSGEAEALAMEELTELWSDAKKPAETKIIGMAILDKYGFKRAAFEGTPYQETNVTDWFMGQIYDAVANERLQEFSYLMDQSDRYATKDFFGKRMHDIFEMARASDLLNKRTFTETYAEEKNWLDCGSEPHSESIFRNGLGEAFNGSRVAFLMRGEFPDKPGKIIEGKLIRKVGNTWSTVYEVDLGPRVVQVDTNKSFSYKVKDLSSPSYREILATLKKEGYKEGQYGQVFRAGDKFMWFAPDPESGRWKLSEATVITPRSGSRAVFTIEANGKRTELNTNSFFSSGNQMFVKK